MNGRTMNDIGVILFGYMDSFFVYFGQCYSIELETCINEKLYS